MSLSLQDGAEAVLLESERSPLYIAAFYHIAAKDQGLHCYMCIDIESKRRRSRPKLRLFRITFRDLFQCALIIQIHSQEIGIQRANRF